MGAARDHLVRGLLHGPELRLMAAFTTASARAARDSHGCAPTSAGLLAQGLTAGLLTAASLEKANARVNLQLGCDGPVGGMFVDAGTDGSARGYVHNEKVFFASGPGEPLAPERGLGRSGYLSVLRDLGPDNNYRGMVALEACELGRDLEAYFRVSEQTEAAVDLAVLPDGDEPLGQVAGVLVQPLPDGDRAAVDRIRTALREGALARALADQLPAVALLERLAGGDGELEIVADYPVAFRCRCSRERALRAVLAMGLEEMRSLFAEIGEARIACHFCGAKYLIAGPELLDLIRNADSQAG
jgi:molecular chaperone Hsp33